MTDNGEFFIDPERSTQLDGIRIRIARMLFELKEQIGTKLYWLGYAVTGFIVYYSKDLYNFVNEVSVAWGLPVRCEIDSRLSHNTIRAAAIVE